MKLNHQIISLIQNQYLHITNDIPKGLPGYVTPATVKMSLVPSSTCTIAVDSPSKKGCVTSIVLTSDNMVVIDTSGGERWHRSLYNEDKLSLTLYAHTEIPKIKYSLAAAIDHLVGNNILVPSTNKMVSISSATFYDVHPDYRLTNSENNELITLVYLDSVGKIIRLLKKNETVTNSNFYNFNSGVVLNVWTKHNNFLDDFSLEKACNIE